MNTNKTNLLTAVQTASDQWKTFFNKGDALGCASCYEENAVMIAKPLGVFNGKKEIEQFWTKLFEEGYKDVVYTNQKIELVNETAAGLSAEWSMNKAKGMIHQELWVLQPDGKARLHRDDFEVFS